MYMTCDFVVYKMFSSIQLVICVNDYINNITIYNIIILFYCVLYYCYVSFSVFAGPRIRQLLLNGLPWINMMLMKEYKERNIECISEEPDIQTNVIFILIPIFEFV